MLLSKLTSIVKVIGIESLSQSLLPAIRELAEDKQWRVRLAIIEYMPLLANQLGMQFFNDKLSAMCLTWLSDSVFSIRQAASLNMQKLAEIFGVEWAKSHILPKIISFNQNATYLHRMTTIFSLTVFLFLCFNLT